MVCGVDNLVEYIDIPSNNVSVAGSLTILSLGNVTILNRTKFGEIGAERETVDLAWDSGNVDTVRYLADLILIKAWIF